MPYLKHKGKLKEAGVKEATVEFEQGDDLHRNSGKWYKKNRLIDRKEDRYKEIIINPDTGEIIHQSDEKLTEHQKHGSAKPPRAAP